MEIAEKDPKSLILLTADMARSNPRCESFVAEFAPMQADTALTLPLNLDRTTAFRVGLTIDQLVRSENQQKAPTRFPSATASAAFGSWGRWTGAHSST